MLTAGGAPGGAPSGAPGAPGAYDANGWSLDAPAAGWHTLEHMQRCVVGVLERCDETAEALAHFVPFLSGHFNCSLVLNRGPPSSTPGAADRASPPEALGDAQRAVVERENALEIRLYAAANAMLDAQLEVARAERPGRGPGLASRSARRRRG